MVSPTRTATPAPLVARLSRPVWATFARIAGGRAESPRPAAPVGQRTWTVPLLLAISWLVLGCSFASANAPLSDLPSEGRPAGESLLPSYTKAAVVIHDADEILEKIRQTRFGQVFEQEELKPLVDEMRRDLEKNLTDANRKLGMSLEDIQGVRTGELTFAGLLPADDSHAIAVVADVLGNDQEARALLAKIAAELTQRGSQKQPNLEEAETSISHFQLPLKRGEAIRDEVFYALANGFVLAADHEEVIRSLVRSVNDQQPDDFKSLEEVTAFQQVQQRLAAANGPEQADFRWFVEPFGLAAAVRNALPTEERGRPVLKILARQGFSAIRGIGGDVTFASEPFEILHRTYVFAPPLEDQTDDGFRYAMAARLLAFKNVPQDNLHPLPFILPETSTYLSFRWNMQQAFDAVGSLADELVGSEGSFDNMLRGMREAPDGPQVDMREELIANFGDQLIMISDVQQPIEPNSERVAMLIPVTDEAAVTVALAKIMAVEPGVVERNVGEITVWEKDFDAIEEENIDEFPVIDPLALPVEGEEPVEEESLAGWNTFTVAAGYLFVANDRELVEQMLHGEISPSLAQTPRFIEVNAALNKAIGSQASFSQFARLDENFRVIFELVRQGKMPQSQSLLGEFLNRQLGTGEAGVLREQQIDPESLPQDEDAYGRLIAPFIGPSGWRGITEDEGYFFYGGMLPSVEEAAMVEDGAVEDTATDQTAADERIRDESKRRE